MKKKLIIISTLIAVIVLSTITALAVNDFSIGKTFGALFKNKESKKEIIAIVYDKEITLYNYNYAKARSPKLSDEEIIDALVESKLLEVDSTQRNISVTDEELYEFIEMQKKLIAETDKDQEPYITLIDMCKELDITLDEYWLLEETQNSYKKFLIQGKLFDEVFKEEGSITTEEKLETKESYIKSLKEKAKSNITIYSEKLK
ncbi:MAG: hypothetical protein PHY15_08835 [Eubacteriales bacterium]|nr:hypothetical protein [Eubacteriales bacterium]MDD4475380.1 hypothetical protein [Eubacteriales bacterium]